MMKFKGLTEVTTVWVDLDDTLIDFTTNAHTALLRMFRTEKLDRWWPDGEVWAASYERHNMSLWAQYNVGDISREYLRMERFAKPLTEAGVDRPTAEELSRRFDTVYLDYLAQEKKLMPGAVELLEHLHTCGVTIGVLSNGFKEVQYRKIHTAGLEPYIDLTILSDDIGVNKPDIRIFEYAMQRSGDNVPTHHLMIGDNPDTDIAGALHAGWNAVHYRPDRARIAGIKEAQGCDCVESLHDIINMVSSLPDAIKSC